MNYPKYQEYKDSDVEWTGQIPNHWTMLPVKRSLTRKKELNTGMKSEHRMSLTMNGVIPRNLDDRD